VTKILAVANQKGGVAKTTTVHSLGDALAERGRKVLLVDLDPQACLTFSAGIDPESLETTLRDVLSGRAESSDARIKTESFDLLPANIEMAGVEVHLLNRTGREYALQRALATVADEYDVIMIDCPPSLGILTINGLTAAHQVLIPLQCETLSHRGVGQLLETIGDVRSFTNEGLSVLGVIATMFDPRTRLAQATLAGVGEAYGLTVLEPPVPKSIRVAEAPGRGSSVLRHAPRSASANAYRSLSEAIL
jgi:chromosome partitioning protein